METMERTLRWNLMGTSQEILLWPVDSILCQNILFNIQAKNINGKENNSQRLKNGTFNNNIKTYLYRKH